MPARVRACGARAPRVSHVSLRYTCAGGGAAPVACPEGFYCPAGAVTPVPCDEGFSCPAGASKLLNNRHFVEYVAANGTSSVVGVLPQGTVESFLAGCRARSDCACVTSAGLMLSSAAPLAAAPSSSSVYAKSNGSACAGGTWLQVPADSCVSPLINVCRPCAVGHWGGAEAAGGYTSDACGGVCACAPGQYCAQSTFAVNGTSGCRRCPIGRFCVGGATDAGMRAALMVVALCDVPVVVRARGFCVSLAVDYSAVCDGGRILLCAWEHCVERNCVPDGPLLFWWDVRRSDLVSAAAVVAFVLAYACGGVCMCMCVCGWVSVCSLLRV